jgi:TolA-binding protein
MDEHELEEIKREIVESRSLTIKTNNLVNGLSADLKSIAKRQHGYERRIFFHSVTAYVVVVAVLMILTKVTMDAQVDSVRAQGKSTRDKLAQVEKDLEAAQARDEARTRAGRTATEFFSLIQNNKLRDIIKQQPEVAKLPLTPTERAIFDDALVRAKNELSLIAYQEGVDQIRNGRWHEAEQALRESLSFQDNAAHSPQANYHLAQALRALAKQRDAIPILMRLSEASADKEVMDDATMLLAQSQVDIQAWNDAKNTLRSFIRRFGKSPHILEARAKLAEIQLYH